MAELRTPTERNGQPQNIATAITEVSERVTTLVHEEIELAKAEVAERTAKLARGAAVGAAAGIFVVTALFFILVGCAWLLYWVLPIGNDFTYFYGFFIMAGILLVLGAIAGVVAARALRSGAPPVPEMAIEEARRIRATVTAGEVTGGTAREVPPAMAADVGRPDGGAA